MIRYLFIHLFSILFLLPQIAGAKSNIKGQIHDNKSTIPFAAIQLSGSALNTLSDSAGNFMLTEVPPGTYTLLISATGYKDYKEKIELRDTQTLNKDIALKVDESGQELEGVVVTGTMKEVSKLSSPVPVEVYTSKFFKANPTPSLFDALQNINGVRPQLNCNICNTGDIHINGLEGPYTMILIDGMPIVSGLATVYGLSGIPQSLIDRIEVVKGPASTLYGSEAVGGLINVITKRPENTPLLAADVFASSWGEVNADLSTKFKVGRNAQSMLGVNYFAYNNPIDNNKDNFTDVTLQNRISVFNKWSFKRKNDRLFSLAARYVYEDRWGGEMDWSKKYRGGDEVYGESIYTKRGELFGSYQLPLKEHLVFQFSANAHDQNSAYGNLFYLAQQNVAFTQLIWNKVLGRHDLLSGISYRYTYYDDNTPATANAQEQNAPSRTHLPGAFVQDEIAFNTKNTLLLGLRYDYNSIHGSILSPRAYYKWNSASKNNVLRIGVGNGYRVANVFTEDHAALTGARSVEFVRKLKPETSWNTNMNFVKKIVLGNSYMSIDASAFYTYFTNKIIADYDTDPNKIIYDNLDGYAISKGFSLNLDLAFDNGLKILTGGTLMDVYSVQNGERKRQLFTEKFTGVWTISYPLSRFNLSFDYTGKVYGPMRLPLLSDADPRQEYSPWWSIQNIQVTKKITKKTEIYGGIKNLLNWTPNRNNPFIIARANDPFDKQVQFDAGGQALKTADNPYGLTFDPSYVYGPNQGRRVFLGMRLSL
ncbi:MAG: TonB-dependent receptor [Bacteroidetes bacterium 43-16]|nr:MAG: TonB-dependent receptor [Bacteroidetes bacterium 43-16]